MKFPTLIIFSDLSDLESSACITTCWERITNGLGLYQFLSRFYSLTQLIYMSMVLIQCHSIVFQFTNKLSCRVEFGSTHRSFTFFITYTQVLVSFGHCIVTFLRTSIDSSLIFLTVCWHIPVMWWTSQTGPSLHSVGHSVLQYIGASSQIFVN